MTSELEKKLLSKLEGGKFRLLNDKLYHKKKLKSKYVKTYHDVYKKQVEKWPANPLDLIMADIETLDVTGKILDLGCGDAKLEKKFKNTISMDLNPINDSITKCNMKKIPLENETVSVVVNCLSLMMCEIKKTVLEVNRVLEMGGFWYIAELRSRIESPCFFAKKLEKMGFKVIYFNTSNKYFSILKLKKISDKLPKKIPSIKLKMFNYKKR